MLRTYYISACFKAWLLCESNVYMQLSDPVNKRHVLFQCMHCAETCFSLLFDLACRPVEVEAAARRCVEACEACAAACEQFDTTDLQRCAQACRRCASALQQLIMPYILN